jgi:hypothetical protein
MDYQNNPNEIQMIEVNDDFYMEFNPWKKVQSPQILKNVPFVSKQITEQEFTKKLIGTTFENQVQKDFWDKLKQIFHASR